MAVNTLQTKAHELIGHLAPGQLAAIVRLLEVMIDGDEELTDDDRHAITESREHLRRHPEDAIPFETMVAECGFTMDQVLGHEETEPE